MCLLGPTRVLLALNVADNFQLACAAVVLPRRELKVTQRVHCLVPVKYRDSHTTNAQLQIRRELLVVCVFALHLLCLKFAIAQLYIVCISLHRRCRVILLILLDLILIRILILLVLGGGDLLLFVVTVAKHAGIFWVGIFSLFLLAFLTSDTFHLVVLISRHLHLLLLLVSLLFILVGPLFLFLLLRGPVLAALRASLPHELHTLVILHRDPALDFLLAPVLQLHLLRHHAQPCLERPFEIRLGLVHRQCLAKRNHGDLGRVQLRSLAYLGTRPVHDFPFALQLLCQRLLRLLFRLASLLHVQCMLQNRGAYVSAFRRLQLDLRVLLTTLALDNKRYALFVVCFRPALQLLVDDRLHGLAALPQLQALVAHLQALLATLERAVAHLHEQVASFGLFLSDQSCLLLLYLGLLGCHG